MKKTSSCYDSTAARNRLDLKKSDKSSFHLLCLKNKWLEGCKFCPSSLELEWYINYSCDVGNETMAKPFDGSSKPSEYPYLCDGLGKYSLDVRQGKVPTKRSLIGGTSGSATYTEIDPNHIHSIHALNFRICSRGCGMVDINTASPEENINTHDETKSFMIREVPDMFWPELRDMYRQNWPYGIYAFYLLENCIRWKSKDEEFPIKIYSPYGDWREGTFVIHAMLGGRSNINMFTLEATGSRLSHALAKSRVLPWSRGPLLCGVHGRHRSCLHQLLHVGAARVERELHSGYHWMPAERARLLDISCPPEVYLADLTEEDVELLNSLWPHNYDGSQDFLREIITFNGGIGLFLKENGNICSWIMKNQFYGLGILQTLPECQGKGYAKLVTKALTKAMGDEGVDVHTCIMRNNAKSLQLFKDLGFEFVDQQLWIQMQRLDEI